MEGESWILTVTQDVIRAIAEIKGWNVEYTQNYWINELTEAQRYSMLSSYGFTPVKTIDGKIINWTRPVEAVAETAGTISSGTGAQVMEIVETQQGKVALQTLPQTTTATNATINGGGAMTAMKVVNGLLVAAVVGGAVARDYKEHTDWWDDLGDAVMQKGEFAGINLGGTTVSYPSDWNAVDAAIDVVRVMGRRVTDFYGVSNYYNYMSATDLACLMQALAAEGVYDPTQIDYDMTTGTITVEGDRDNILGYALNINNRHNTLVATTAGTILPSTLMASAIAGLLDRAPSDYSCLSMSMGCSPNSQIDAYVYLFKASDPCEVVGNTGITAGTNSIYGTVGNIYCAHVLSKTDGTMTVDYSMPTNVPLYMGFASSIDPNVGNYGNTFAGNGNSTYHEGGIPEQGIYPQDNANPFAVAATATIAEVLQALQDQYPDWWGEGFSVGSYDPDTGTFGDEYWLPISIPWTNPNDAPYNTPDGYDQPYATTGKPYPDPQSTPTGYGTPYPYGWDIPYTVPTIPYLYPNNPTPVPTDTPSSPSTPPAVTGSSNALWAVYNPTFSEVSALGSYLWSSSIIDIIQKFFSNPMDSIISLHMIYTTPATGAAQNIKLGYLDSGVSALTVTNQYKIVDCGTILVPEYFHDVRDYSPYCKVDIFLPFIGIRSLSPEDVINCKLNCKYTVDVLTGAILAELYITKRGATQCLYTFAGNGAVQIPLTGGDRTRLLSGIISGATAIAGGAAVGGLAGAAAGAVHGVAGLHNTSNVERTGNFSANAGAMGIKKPYLIINRKDSYDATDYNKYYGFPCNIACKLSTCKGYTKVNSVHVDIAKAMEEEKTEIMAALTSGVIIS